MRAAASNGFSFSGWRNVRAATSLDGHGGYIYVTAGIVASIFSRISYWELELNKV